MGVSTKKKSSKNLQNSPLLSQVYYSSVLKDKKQAQKYLINKNTFLNAYSFFVLLENRISGSMPCWEGIRIVREKIK
ncbi:MAG: hypothetical protein HC930_09095 [Hydrococcus sp. SU_1_0]|nr:hypothetical protein [Hydrococcus sp. SU_1_0]